MKTFGDLSFDKNRFLKEMFKTGDRDALQLFAYQTAASVLGNIYEEYSRIFGLCYLLGGLNVYDIGCGDHHQACLLYRQGDMTYTGIDAHEKFDCDRMNSVFGTDHIRFIRDLYPCKLRILPGNAAIARGWMYSDPEPMKHVAKAVSRDFDRLIANARIEKYTREDMLRFWEEEMPGFRAVPIDDENLILATRIPEDFSVMEYENYKYGNSAFAIRSL